MPMAASPSPTRAPAAIIAPHKARMTSPRKQTAFRSRPDAGCFVAPAALEPTHVHAAAKGNEQPAEDDEQAAAPAAGIRAVLPTGVEEAAAAERTTTKAHDNAPFWNTGFSRANRTELARLFLHDIALLVCL